MQIVKPIIRLVVIGGLATGVAVLVAGPERVTALAGQARQCVIQKIDANIKDPVALRSQLRSLEAEYPKRIAEVRSDLAELNVQLAEIQRDRDVSAKVVELAAADMAQLKDMLARAESTRTERPFAVISVRFEDRDYPLDQAYTRATQVGNTLAVYQARVEGADRDMGFLKQQQERLSELLTQLENERAQFQAQIFQLDGQIEMIARNDKLINIVERRQETIDKHSRYDAVSLEQITTRMEKIRAEQESRLQSLTSRSKGVNYEQKAQIMLDTENAAKKVFEKTEESIAPAVEASKTIQITPTGSTNESDKTDGPVASAERVRVE